MIIMLLRLAVAIITDMTPAAAELLQEVQVGVQVAKQCQWKSARRRASSSSLSLKLPELQGSVPGSESSSCFRNYYVKIKEQ